LFNPLLLLPISQLLNSCIHAYPVVEQSLFKIF